MADDPMIPELQLGIARLGGYKAAVGLANLNTARDATSAWIVAERGTGLIRSLSSKQVVAEYGGELSDLNDGKGVSESQLGKGSWWKSRLGLAKNETLAQAYNSDKFDGLDLGGRAFITHRPAAAKAAGSVTGSVAVEEDDEDDL